MNCDYWEFRGLELFLETNVTYLIETYSVEIVNQNLKEFWKLTDEW